MVNFRICGPKLSAFGAVLSIWGIIQLTFMGFAFYYNAVALVEDLHLPNEPYASMEKLKKDIEDGYSNNTENCFVAVALYFVTLVFSLHQLWMNNVFVRPQSYARQYDIDLDDLQT